MLDYKNKKVLIVGLGLLGRGWRDARFFAQQGAQVTVTDLKTKKELQPSIDKLKKYKIKYVLGKHNPEDFKKQDLIIRGPSVPLNSFYFKIAQKHKIPIEMDESLFAKNFQGLIIGVTGTRGKTTTSTLIYEILKKYFKKNIYLAGNIVDTATLPLINKISQHSIVVMELSSWQLQGWHTSKISPHLSVITNIYPDHLNYYQGSMEKYVADKKAIYQYQGAQDFLFLNQDNNYTKKFQKETKSRIKFFSYKNVPKSWSFKIQGQHNLENIAVAIQVAQNMHIPLKIIKQVVTNFKGVPDRLEKIRTFKKVDYYNDTTATTPEALISGLQALGKNKNIVLITGGADKQLSFSKITPMIKKHVKKIILLEGTGTDRMKKFLPKNLINNQYTNLKSAVLKAQELSQVGNIILFSPACASFGMFINEFDRGRQFKKIVKNLK
ncbi:MAG: UDP-N-acetylmuramoyl-L-alanine--D-glutamate ligase [Patescibacteria group bacterium]|nr:UDP-N-acetylmuramoyl-L-alanine--D-glutamate ligase [Patescibacteria group bacterium]